MDYSKKVRISTAYDGNNCYDDVPLSKVTHVYGSWNSGHLRTFYADEYYCPQHNAIFLLVSRAQDEDIATFLRRVEREEENEQGGKGGKLPRWGV